ncbi:GNAT family N-acetyltransferase [Bacillus massiliigorillae]|uniref:GNAT family N-acetyltransferase n=1 Tax=Bacillus massiliigorillae TaxID=1243664 RepID=UPI0003A1EA0E|nr:GNAT family N-acetyltransferase [Bacillus massiliigorillae]
MIVKIVKDKQQLEDAYAIRQKVFIEEQQVDVEEEIDEHDQIATHFVLYDDSKPIGAGRFRIVDGAGKVERICVLANVRKAGAGKMIMNEIEKYAQSQQVSKVKLNAQTHAIGFYEILGYEIVSEEFLDAGIPHRTMVKSL